MPEPFVFQTRVRFGDTDASGRIFYASLLRHFDAAESEFLRSLGCPYAEFGIPKILFPRVRVECDYTSSLVFDDLMDITVSVDTLGRSSFTLGFAVATAGRPAARGKIVIVAVDPKTQRSTPLPEGLRNALAAYVSRTASTNA